MKRMVPAAFCGLLLLGGCYSLPDTIAATGPVGHSEFSVGVDSPEAAYYLGRYLNGYRGWESVDRRIDALYAADAGVLPDRYRLAQIAEEFSVDFAAIYFADLLYRQPANRFLRSTYEAHLNRARAAPAETPGDALLPAAADYVLVFVPAYHYERHEHTGADLAISRRTLRQAGLRPLFVATDEVGAIESNAGVVADYLRRATRPDDKVVMVSASKSSPEVALAISRLDSDVRARVKGWINIVGTLQGTPLADEVMGEGPLSHFRDYVDDPGMRSMMTAPRRAAFRRLDLHDDLLVINYIGIPVTSTISREVHDGYVILRDYGPNDGLNLLADLVAPRSVTLADFGRDHYLIDETLPQRTIALVNTAVEWLESCAVSREQHWTALAETADCAGDLAQTKGQ